LWHDKVIAHIGVVVMLEHQFWTATERPVIVAMPLTEMVVVAEIVMDF